MVRSTTFKLFRFCGTFPLTSRGVVNKTLYVYSFLIIFTILSLYVYDCIFFFLPQYFSSNEWAIKSCNIIEILACLGVILAHVSSLVVNRHKFEQFWKAFELKSVQCLEATMLISSLITCMNDFSVYYVDGLLHDLAWRLDLSIFMTTTFAVGLIQAQFIAAFETLGTRLGATARRVRRHIDISKHSTLVTMNSLAMEIYEWQILFSILLIAVGIVRMSYEIYTGLAQHEWISSSCTLGNLLIKLTQLITIVHVFEKNNVKAEEFNNELFKLMRENDQLSKDNKLFLYVTTKRTVNFTACGFFNLGYPLVTSIFTAATTYLVILLQFSE